MTSAPTAANSIPAKVPADKTPEDLLKAVNDSSKALRALALSFLGFALYVLVAASTTTQDTLLFELPLTLPVLNAGVPLTGFYVLAPALLLILHFDLALHLHLHAEKMRSYRASRSRLNSLIARRNLDHQLEQLPLTQLLSRRPQAPAIRWLLLGIVWGSVVVMPVLVLLALQISFLAFQSELITWLHRLFLLLDLALLVFFLPKLAAPGIPVRLWWRYRITSPSSILRVAWAATTRRLDLRGALRLYGRLARHGVAKDATLFLLFLPALALAFSGALIPDEPLEKWWLTVLPAPEAGSTSGASWARLGIHWNELFQVPRKSSNGMRGATMLTACLFENLGGNCPGVTRTSEPRLIERSRTIFQRTLHISPQRMFLGKPASPQVELELRQRKLAAAEGITPFDFSGRNFRYASLSEAVMPRALFIDSDLRGAQLSGASLQGVVVMDSNLAGAKLIGADLRGAQFINATLDDASFAQANATGLEISYSSAKRVSFRQSRMSFCAMSEVRAEHADWSDADLTGCELFFLVSPLSDWSRARLLAAHVRGSKLEGALLNGTWLAASELKGVNFDHSLATCAGFQGVRFSLATLANRYMDTTINIRHALLDQADFRAADLRSFDMSNSTLIVGVRSSNPPPKEANALRKSFGLASTSRLVPGPAHVRVARQARAADSRMAVMVATMSPLTQGPRIRSCSTWPSNGLCLPNKARDLAYQSHATRTKPCIQVALDPKGKHLESFCLEALIEERVNAALATPADRCNSLTEQFSAAATAMDALRSDGP